VVLATSRNDVELYFTHFAWHGIPGDAESPVPLMVMAP